MTILRIEHPVTDYETWRARFDDLAGVRRGAGVTAERVARPVDDPRYILVDLEFDAIGPARSFLAFLETQVWADPAASPALVGTPRTAVLDPA